MAVLRRKSLRLGLAAVAFGTSALLTAGHSIAAPGDYCNYVDAAVYCGVEENIVFGDPGFADCSYRWRTAILTCLD